MEMQVGKKQRSPALCMEMEQQWSTEWFLIDVQGGNGEGARQQVRSSLTVISMAAMKQPDLVAERLDLLLKVCILCLPVPSSPFPPRHLSACSSILSCQDTTSQHTAAAF